MGYGDEIMVTGQVAELVSRNGQPVCVFDRNNKIRRHPMWLNNPNITYEVRGSQLLINGPGKRPYVDYKKTTKTRWAYTNWKVTRGQIYFSEKESKNVKDLIGMVLIEPNIKTNASPNKLWGFDKCQRLVNSNPQIPWVQIRPQQNKWLKNVREVVTPTFRDAIVKMWGLSAFVSPEGGIHHAAAALGVPGVVIFGEMTSPLNTGYDTHINLTSGNNPCGWRIPCVSCKKVMNSITPELVMKKLEALL